MPNPTAYLPRIEKTQNVLCYFHFHGTYESMRMYKQETECLGGEKFENEMQNVFSQVCQLEVSLILINV